MKLDVELGENNIYKDTQTVSLSQLSSTCQSMVRDHVCLGSLCWTVTDPQCDPLCFSIFFWRGTIWLPPDWCLVIQYWQIVNGRRMVKETGS